jgi:hypothetical protein
MGHSGINKFKIENDEQNSESCLKEMFIMLQQLNPQGSKVDDFDLHFEFPKLFSQFFLVINHC